MELVKEKYFIAIFLVIGFNLVLFRGWFMLLSGSRELKWGMIIAIICLHLFIAYRTYRVLFKKVEITVVNNSLIVKEGFFEKKIDIEGIYLMKNEQNTAENWAEEKSNSIANGFKDFFGTKVPNSLEFLNRKGEKLKIDGLTPDQVSQIKEFVEQKIK